MYVCICCMYSPTRVQSAFMPRVAALRASWTSSPRRSTTSSPLSRRWRRGPLPYDITLWTTYSTKPSSTVTKSYNTAPNEIIQERRKHNSLDHLQQCRWVKTRHRGGRPWGRWRSPGLAAAFECLRGWHPAVERPLPRWAWSSSPCPSQRAPCRREHPDLADGRSR